MTIVIRCEVNNSSGRHKRVTLILTLQIKVWWGKRYFPSSVFLKAWEQAPMPSTNGSLPSTVEGSFIVLQAWVQELPCPSAMEAFHPSQEL